jgi:hypothetical protein
MPSRYPPPGGCSKNLPVKPTLNDLGIDKNLADSAASRQSRQVNGSPEVPSGLVVSRASIRGPERGVHGSSALLVGPSAADGGSRRSSTTPFSACGRSVSTFTPI